MDRYTNACRICLKEDGIKIPIFEEEGLYRRVAEKLRDCLNIPVYQADPLPKQICNRCFYKLDLASELKQECHHSNVIFIHHLSCTQRDNQSAREYLRLVLDRPQAHVTPTSQWQPAPVEKRRVPDSSLSIRKAVPLMAAPGASMKRPLPVDTPSSSTRSSGSSVLEKTGSTQISSSAISCEVCDREFGSRKLLSVHILMHTREEFLASPKRYEYACDICGRTFEQPKSLKMHSIKYHKIRLLDASPHKKLQEDSPSLLNIKQEPDELNPFECNVCYRLFETADLLLGHMHTDHKNITTPSKMTSSNTFYKDQPKDTRPECIYCFQTFKGNKGLVLHLRTAHGKPSCSVCLEIFDTHEELVTHRITLHRQAPTPPPDVNESDGEFTCEQCGKSFERQVSLAKHKIYHMRKGPGWTPINIAGSPIVEKPPTAAPEGHDVFKCEHCGKEFDRHISFVRHKAIHTKKGPSWVPLEMQGKPNSTQNVVQVNNEEGLKPSEDNMKKLGINKQKLKSNNSGLPYCLYCKKLYGNNMKLWEHVRKVHASSERYKCPHSGCRRVFFTKNGYKSHLTTHKNSPKGADPPVADDSSSSQSTISTLPFPCDLCTKAFSTRANLKRHMVIKHSSDSSNTTSADGDHEVKKQGENGEVNGKQVEVPNRVKVVHPRVLCRYCPKYLSKRYMVEHIKIHRRAGHKPLPRNPGVTNTQEEKDSTNSVTVKKEKVSTFVYDKPGPLSRKLLWQKQQKRNSFKKPLCKYCNTYVATFVELRAHLTEIHHDCIFFSCNKCPEVYYTEMSLRNHVISHNRLYSKCKYCARSFAYLAAHEKTCVSRNESSEVITSAKSSATPPPSPTAQTLTPKRDKEEGPKIYTCDFCGSQFLETHSFVKHLQSHAQ